MGEDYTYEGKRRTRGGHRADKDVGNAECAGTCVCVLRREGRSCTVYCTGLYHDPSTRSHSRSAVHRHSGILLTRLRTGLSLFNVILYFCLVSECTHRVALVLLMIIVIAMIY